MRQRRGFTLVELLVVIGIIALLISILLPSLNRARSSANLVACQSNFRQIYTALSFYSVENKGLLPYASFYAADKSGNYDKADSPDGGSSGTNARVFIELSRLLGTDIKNVWTDPLNKVFICTEAQLDGGAIWCPPMIRTIQFHPRAMPGYDALWGEKDNPNKEWPQRKLSSIKNAAEKIAFWEGPQIMNWNACPEPESTSWTPGAPSTGTSTGKRPRPISTGTTTAGTSPWTSAPTRTTAGG